MKTCDASGRPVRRPTSAVRTCASRDVRRSARASAFQHRGRMSCSSADVAGQGVQSRWRGPMRSPRCSADVINSHIDCVSLTALAQPWRGPRIAVPHALTRSLPLSSRWLRSLRRRAPPASRRRDERGRRLGDLRLARPRSTCRRELLQFDVTRSGQPAIVAVDFSAASAHADRRRRWCCRSRPRARSKARGRADVESSLTFSGEGDGTLAGTGPPGRTPRRRPVDGQRPSEPAAWSSRFARRATGSYTMPVRFVLSTP